LREALGLEAESITEPLKMADAVTKFPGYVPWWYQHIVALGFVGMFALLVLAVIITN
jgi:hypothetical protein